MSYDYEGSKHYLFDSKARLLTSIPMDLAPLLHNSWMIGHDTIVIGVSIKVLLKPMHI